MSTYVNCNGEVIDMKALAGKARDHRAIVGMPQTKRKPTVANGYAAKPGTGPEGKTCRDCEHKHTMGHGHSKTWIKCELMRPKWTGGTGTDIRASSPACQHFTPKVAAAEERSGSQPGPDGNPESASPSPFLTNGGSKP